MAIIPVPANRTSELLVQQRLLAQLATSQIDLLKLETQISSGQRLTLPSDDAPAALRAISLKALLDRKGQIKTNLTTNQSYLSATDSALSQVANVLTAVRGDALSVVGNLASDAQRTAVANQVHEALTQLVNTGNQQFRGRYLFGGSRLNSAPFSLQGQAVLFSGNRGTLSSFADVGLLFPTNSDGDAVFGALSPGVDGTTQLAPVLTDNTRLANLHFGQGINQATIQISDGAATSTIDLSKASTIGDVISLIEHNPPAGRTLTVTPTGDHLNVSLDVAGGGSLTILDVGTGTSASDLGVLQIVGQGTSITGKSVDPRVTVTTPLTNLLGIRASTSVVSPGAKNDIVIQARANGTALNGVQVSFVNNNALVPGQETVTYNANNQTLIVDINAAQSTADNVVNAINNDAIAGPLFEAQLSTHDVGSLLNTGTTLVDPTAVGTLSGGSGIQLDQSGLQINSAGKTYTINLAQVKTVGDLLNQLNGSAAGVLAEINADGTSINVHSRLSGVDFSIGENGGATATQLGIRSFTAATRLEDLNHGAGVQTFDNQPDFAIRRKDGVALNIDISGAQTIGDVLNLINNDAGNQDPAHKVTAQLAAFGNGIELVSNDASTTASLGVLEYNGGHTARDLGLIPKGATVSAPPVTVGTTDTLTGADVNPLEVKGVFNALLRLENALRSNNDTEVGRAVSQMQEAATQVNLAAADLGAREQGIDSLKSSLSSEVTNLKQALSDEIDTDLPTAVSDLASRQAAFQAALQTAATVSKLTLLNYL